MSGACQKLAFTHQIIVLKSGLKNSWMKKIGWCEPKLISDTFSKTYLTTGQVQAYQVFKFLSFKCSLI